MSIFPRDSPVQRLNNDILRYIIEINANMFDDDTALETTLFISHVCRAWRTFMLGLPAIWAHLIDLDLLHGCGDEWMRELFRRSGTVLLWIKTRRCAFHGMTNPTDCTKYVLDIIGENWSRIQRLEATFDAGYVDAAQWTPLYLPAPHIESLSLIFSRRTSKFEFSFRSLFGGNAPLLREFSSKGFRSNLSGPWLQQLHCLQLNADLTALQTLEVLKVATSLVNLRLDHTARRFTISPLPLVALPKLDNLSLNLVGKLQAGIVLLDHLKIPHGCSLEFTAQLLRSGDMVSEIALVPITIIINQQKFRSDTQLSTLCLRTKHNSINPNSYLTFRHPWKTNSLHTHPPYC